MVVLNLQVDGTGEWQVCKLGVHGRRQWRKGHWTMDTAASGSSAVEFTSSSGRPSPALQESLNQTPKRNSAHHTLLRPGVLETMNRKYHVRSRIEAGTRCLKALGERIAESRTAEIQIHIALMNRFSTLGTAEIVRAAHC